MANPQAAGDVPLAIDVEDAGEATDRESSHLRGSADIVAGVAGALLAVVVAWLVLTMTGVL